MALFVLADVTARLSTSAYARLYAKSGGSTADATFAALCVAETESVVRTLTKAAFPAGFDAAGGTVDVAIVGACVDLCNELAATRHASATEQGSYKLAGDRARAYLKALKADEARPVTSASGRAKPVASVTNAVDSAGTPTNEYVRAADHTDASGY